MLNDQFFFAFRMAGVATGLVIMILLLPEIYARIKARKFDLAFTLIIGCFGTALGFSSNLLWNSIYYLSVVSKQPAPWMLNAFPVPLSVSILMLSAIFLLRAIAMTKERIILSIAFILLTGIASYIWIGQYL